jgi:putative metallohydrolase (TIGR04338 family)
VKLGTQQAALYAAEAGCLDGQGRRWQRLADVQAYVDELTTSSWFFERWPWFVRCQIERRGSGSVWSTCERLDRDGPDGRATEGVILLAARSLTQPVVLHELGHLLLPPDSGHGPDFAQTLLTLVRREMGFVAFADLFEALREVPGYDLNSAECA